MIVTYYGRTYTAIKHGKTVYLRPRGGTYPGIILLLKGV